jgi:hypothetical protein
MMISCFHPSFACWHTGTAGTRLSFGCLENGSPAGDTGGLEIHRRFAMRAVLCAIGLAGALWMPVNAYAQSWAEYRPKEVGLRIEMPGKPKVEQQKTKGGNISNRAIVTYRDFAFMLNYGEKNEKPRPNVEALLDTIVSEMLQGAKILSSKKEMVSGFPARRVSYEDADKDQFELRVLIGNDRVIQAIFIGPAGNALGRRFLDSLAIVEP